MRKLIVVILIGLFMITSIPKNEVIGDETTETVTVTVTTYIQVNDTIYFMGRIYITETINETQTFVVTNTINQTTTITKVKYTSLSLSLILGFVIMGLLIVIRYKIKNREPSLFT